MLRELSVQNMVLLEDVRVELQPWLRAWTGDTGAGKDRGWGRTPTPVNQRSLSQTLSQFDLVAHVHVQQGYRGAAALSASDDPRPDDTKMAIPALSPRMK